MTASHFLETSGVETLPELQFESDFNDIRVDINGPICKVHFDFYNGGMTPQQGRRLEATLKAVAVRDDVTVVALMGGDRLFSTGINLCDIETSSNKEELSLRTINQIDDVIRAMFSMTNKLTVAVLQGNAGAGGAMMAAAADVVVTHPGVLLTPSYKNIRLTGSEYWTYFLPQRVGHVKAEELVNTEVPINAEEAKSIGLLDDIIGKSKIDFLRSIDAYLTDVLYSGKAELLIHKKRHRDSEWFKKLEEHRHREIEQMIKDLCPRDSAWL